ncbi:MAG: methyltransferase domain-containing protein [Rickettsiales bacterium]|nr:methyltransferase domain-containing protein [Rickettsiales bacterium]
MKLNENKTQAECILCGNKHHIEIKNKNANSFEICTSCGIIRNIDLTQKTQEFEIKNKFSISKIKLVRALNQAKFLLEQITKFIEPPKFLLDISARNGVFANLAKDKNFNVIATEENPNYANFIRNTFGLTTLNDNIFNINFSQKFDIITILNSFCDYQKPFNLLEKINLSIKENGILLLGFRDIENPKVSPKRLFSNEISYFFNYENLKWLLFKAGFEIIDDFSQEFSNFRYFTCKRVRKPNSAVTIPLKENFEKIFHITSEYNSENYYKNSSPYNKFAYKIKTYPKEYFS